jgi:hypothetical protein
VKAVYRSFSELNIRLDIGYNRENLSDGPVAILESYISPQVLPNERIIGYVKWDPSAPIKTAVLKMEADVFLERILNIREEVFSSYSALEGKLTIAKEDIQISGYAGFVALYRALPDGERQLRFTIDLVLEDDRLQTVVLTTNVVRPVLKSIDPIAGL